MRAPALLLVVIVASAGCSSRGVPSASAPNTEPDQLAKASSEVRADPVAAAIAYVASTDDLMAHSPIGRAEIFRKMVVDDAVDENVEAFEQVAANLAATLDLPVERLSWVEAPL